MPSTVRRSQELQKKLQRRNNSLKPADFMKDQNVVSLVETKKDPVEKSKKALSDLRKRIDERKRMSKLINIEQYQEKREENIPDLTGVTFSESPIAERQEPSSQDEAPGQTIMRSTQKQKQNPNKQEKLPVRSIKNHYRDQDRYRNDISEEAEAAYFDKVPPSHIEVRATDTSENDDDDDNNTDVSSITTDVRLMSMNGASYAERRMAGSIQARLAKPSLMANSGPQLERDVNINLTNLRNLGKAVEKAKMDLRKNMSPRRHGLPYETTDYRPSVDEDEIDSWGDAIRTCSQKQTNKINSPIQKQEENGQFIADNTAAKKLQTLVKEAYSYEGDVFIDATEIREEDLDGELLFDEAGNQATPIKIDDTSPETAVLLGDEILPFEMEEEKMVNSGYTEERNEFAQQSREEADRDDLSQKGKENGSPNTSFEEGTDHENIKSDDQILGDSENKSSSFTNKPAAIASDLYNSSLGFLKSFGHQVDTQLKSFQERGLISKSDVDGMLGVLEHDVHETKTKLPKDGDDVVIFLGDEFEAVACGTDSGAAEVNSKNAGSNSDPVERMLESLKKSYNIGISKCGIDGDLIKENTKAIETMVANLKNAKRNSSEFDQNISGVATSKVHSESLPEEKIDGNLLKELSAEGVKDMVKDSTPFMGAQEEKRNFVTSM